MKKLFTLSLGMFLAFAAAGQNDAQATRLLDKAYAKYESAESIEAKFSMLIELPEQGNETQSGIMRQKGTQYMIDTDSYAVYNNNEVIYIHMKDAQEVQIMSPEDDDEEGIPSMDDILGLYKSGDFEYQMMPGSGSDAVIEFKPLSEDSEYFKLRMTLDKSSSIPKSMIFFNKDASKYTVTLDKIQWDAQLSDTLFAFDKTAYPDVYIEDLRVD